MTPRYFDRATRDVTRHSGMRSDAFDRFMDTRQRRAARHHTAGSLVFGHGFSETTEIERRSLADVFAPTRN